MAYLDDLHMNKKLFHGDIKPANIFLGLSSGTITTDSGSLIPLYKTNGDRYYLITTLTPYYSSAEHYTAGKEGTKRTYNELLKEDFYQMKMTINCMVKQLQNDNITVNTITQVILDKMNRGEIETCEELRKEILEDQELCLGMINYLRQTNYPVFSTQFWK